jgi:Zn/Cd-binding protein ZinT
MYNLPEEIVDQILNIYWHFNYNKVIEEINGIINLESKIYLFLKRFSNTTIKENNLYYYKKFNTEVREITKNKGKMIFCKNNQLKLSYCNKEYIEKICKNIKEDYRYIAPLLIMNSGHLRYTVHSYLLTL